MMAAGIATLLPGASSTAQSMNSSALKARPATIFGPSVSRNCDSAMYTVALSVGCFWSFSMFTDVFHDELTNGTWLVTVAAFTPGRPRSTARSLRVSASAFVVLADAGELHADDFVLGDAADEVDSLDAVADQEHRVADDRAAQRDLEHDQGRRGLVAQQGGQNGAQFHGSSPNACRR